MKTETIFSIVLYLTSAVFVVMEIRLLYSIFRSRLYKGSLYDNDKQSPRPWEAVWSVIPAAILLVLILII